MKNKCTSRMFCIGIYREKLPSLNTCPNWAGAFEAQENTMDFLAKIRDCFSLVLPNTKAPIRLELKYPNEIRPTCDMESSRAWVSVIHASKHYWAHAVKLVDMPS